MPYRLMCCFEEKAWERRSETEKGRIMVEYREMIRRFVKNGQLRGSGRLHPTSAATTVRMKHGKMVLTDGPFAETKERFGGYHIVECKDLDEAISMAARIPTRPAGDTVEVRPLAMVEGQQ